MQLALPIVIIGLVGLIISFAFYELERPVLTALFGKIPLVGNALSGWFDDSIQSAYLAVIGRVAGWIGGLGEVFHIPIWTLQSLIQIAGASIQSAFNALTHLQFVTIPQQGNNLLGLIWDRFYAAEAAAVVIGNNVLGVAWTLYYQARAYADTVGNNVLGVAWTLYYQARSYADTVGNNVLGVAWTLYYQSLAYSLGLAQTLDGFITTSTTQLTGLIWDRFHTAEADARAYTDAGVSQLEQQIAGVQAQNAAKIAAEAATLGGAIALVRTAVQTLEDSPCIKQCSTLGTLGQDLSELGELATVAALIAWLGQSVHDPQAAAGEVQAALGGVGKAAAQVTEAVGGF